MKIIIPDISTVYPKKYSLIREIDNYFIVEKFEANIEYFDADHKFLVERWAFGDSTLSGSMEKDCGENTFTKNVFIKHNEGEFDLRGCKTTKEVTIENVLDCVLGTKEINIFDYDRSTTNTIQGDAVDRETIEINEEYLFTTDNYSFQDILNVLNLDNREDEGYFIESGNIKTTVKILEVQGPDEYTGHQIKGTITYFRVRSSTQHSPKWTLIPGDTDYFYSGIQSPEFSLVSVEPIYINDVNPYFEKSYRAGRANVYQQIEISNTILINPILEDVFSCTGKTLRSNFLNINPDTTAPNNKYYDWAANFAQNIKIVQSYDILKEDAESDSFGASGKIKVKKLLLSIFKAFGLRLTPDGDDIRIEHFTYFTNKGIDLTEKTYEFKPLKANQDRVDSETFTFAKQVVSHSFYKAFIEYETNNLYSEDNDVPHAIELMLTDVFGGINNDSLVEDGTYEEYFFLLCTDGDSIIELNNPFSMVELVKELHDTNRPMKRGKLNGEEVVFGANSLGAMGEIVIDSNVMAWDGLKPLMSVETLEGFYIIDSVSINENNILTIKIKK